MTRAQAMAYRALIMKAANSLDDSDAIEAPELFEKWSYPRAYETGDRRCHDGKLYKCLQPHTSQQDWTPDTAVSLWVEIADPSVEWPEWKQPVGAHDAYSKDDKVSHNEKHWMSDVDNNVWEPGVYGWTEQV